MKFTLYCLHCCIKQYYICKLLLYNTLVNITTAFLLVCYCSIKLKIFTNRLRCQSIPYVMTVKGYSPTSHWNEEFLRVQVSHISFSVSNFSHCLWCYFLRKNMDCSRFADGCGKNISTDSIKPLKDSSVSSSHSATTNNHPSVAHPSTYRQTLYMQLNV